MKKRILIIMLALFLLLTFWPHNYNFDAIDLLIPPEELPEGWNVKSTISGQNNRSVLNDFPYVVDIVIEEYSGTNDRAHIFGRSLHAVYPNYVSAFYGLIEYGLFDEGESDIQISIHKWKPWIYVSHCPNSNSIRYSQICHFIFLNGTIVSRLDLRQDGAGNLALPMLFQQKIDLIMSSD